jgi:hypothetical protein
LIIALLSKNVSEKNERKDSPFEKISSAFVMNESRSLYAWMKSASNMKPNPKKPRQVLSFALDHVQFLTSL